MLFEADAAAGVLADAASLTARPTLYLKGLAQRVYEAGKPDCTTWDQFRKDMTRYDLMDLQQNAWDAIEAGDAASGSIMLTRCLSSTLDVLYESRGWWGVKPKRRLQDLKENALLMNLSSMTERKDAESNSSSLTTTTRNDATQALQLSRRIARNDLELEQRFKSLKSLVAVVVAPLGGDDRLDDGVGDDLMMTVDKQFMPSPFFKTIKDEVFLKIIVSLRSAATFAILGHATHCL